MATKLTWTDQPPCLTDARVIFNGSVGERHAEVRLGKDGTFYVTQGNLFGSQTLRCDGPEAAFAAIGVIASECKSTQPPEGCKVMSQ